MSILSAFTRIKGRTFRYTVKKTSSVPAIEQIAKKAGVSNATVSRVINGQKIVSPPTFSKVSEAMKEMGYPLDSSTHVANITQGIILFNVPTLENPFYHDIAMGAKKSANLHGYHCLINSQDIDVLSLDQLTKMIRRTKISGIIVTNHVAEDILNKLNMVTCVVQCCEYAANCNLPFVSIDDYAAARSAIQHILSTGRRKIALINGPTEYKYARERKRGYLSAMESAGIEPPESWQINVPSINFEIAYSSVIQLLSSSNPPDSFFTASDVFAAAAVKAAQQIGLHVPNDIVIVGFDDLETAKMTSPTISSVKQPRYQMGYIASEILLEKVKDPNTEPRKILLASELIVRQSSSGF